MNNTLNGTLKSPSLHLNAYIFHNLLKLKVFFVVVKLALLNGVIKQKVT